MVILPHVAELAKGGGVGICGEVRADASFNCLRMQ
jgi:hypothetical protein